jgi:hypothetical protein
VVDAVRRRDIGKNKYKWFQKVLGMAFLVCSPARGWGILHVVVWHLLGSLQAHGGTPTPNENV